MTALKKYAVFSGRSRRREFWWFVLINFIISSIIGCLSNRPDDANYWDYLGDDPNFWNYLGLVYGLAVLIPTIAVQVRRLHDTGRTGWWWFIGLVPCVGWIVLLVFNLFDSEPGPNKYGPNPKGA
ncbi:DUF805 domain-containing protein [Glycomyces algeriensis]|uniref:DUF805 domain-containing protein n=2 Tax=Glycomyces algeriensis TaxID=256037 RepID=A0A9W6LGT6_9ACTN|nr:DUF805 domain-containing protein [Glycomyces algeriensis]